MTDNIVPYRSLPLQGVKMSIAPSGLEVSFRGSKTRGIWLAGCKRGTIKGWSKASARRLRQALFKYYVPDSDCWGITLTLPWSKEFCNSDSCPTEFRNCFHTFVCAFERTFPRSAMIYRIELTQKDDRHCPHIHAVFWLHKDDCASLKMSYQDTVRLMWWQSVPDKHGGNIADHFKYGVAFSQMDGIDRMNLYRYLADHASKHKQGQLGWIGRQWGIVQRKNLQEVATEELWQLLDQHQEGVFWRMIRKLTSYHVKADCVFGYKRVGGNRRSGVIFVKGGGEIVRRCFDFARQQKGK